MIDLQPAPVPELSEDWIVSHRAVLVDALSRPPRSPVKWVALTGATGVATVSGVFLALSMVGGSASYAFAGWSASPTAPASGQLIAADSTCQASLAQLGSTDKGTDPASLVPELSDVRGPFTVTVFGNGTQGEAACLSAPDATSLRWIASPGGPATPGAIRVDQVSFLARDGQPYTLVVGRTGTGVTGVTLSLADGETVAATSGNGFFVAWWPGSQTITSAAVATATGLSTQTLNLPGPGNPPAGKPAPPLPGAEPSNSGSSGETG